MTLAIINGLITSLTLETIILLKQNFKFKNAVKTAFGMSFISMISMEITMNFTDFIFTGGAVLNWYVLPVMLLAGFLTPLPYNYYKLKKAGCLFQLNLLSLTEQYGRNIQKISSSLLEKNLYDFAASDIHHLTHLELLKNIGTKQNLIKIKHLLYHNRDTFK